MKLFPLELNLNPTLNMNIDWKELEQGFTQELAKTSGLRDGFNKIKNITPKLKPIVKPAIAVGAGTGLVNAAGDAMSGIGNMVDSAKSLLPMGLMGLAAMSGGGKGAGASGGGTHTYYPSQHSPSYLTPDPGTVSGFSNPRKYSSPFKQADVIFDSLGEAVKRRVANSILNEVTSTNPLGMDLPGAAANTDKVKPEELEITSRYPEMQAMLQDEKNKAYLQKLLHK